MPMKFAERHISYTENRADNGAAWTVSYALSGDGDAVTASLGIDLVGADPGALKATWLNGINTIWNNKVFYSDGSRLYEVKVNAKFVDSGADQIVTVHQGSGPDDMTNWYIDQPSLGLGKQDELAAHQVGHMLGNFDEHKGGATVNGYTTTKTLMSDYTVRGMEHLYFGLQFYAQQLSKLTLDTVAAEVGTAGNDIYTGDGNMNGVYGLAGEDVLSGLDGNDFIDGGAGGDSVSGGAGNDILRGGAGGDVLTGGLGRDTLTGGRGADSFTFDTRPAKANIDRIVDFQDGTDTIWLDNDVFTKLTAINKVDTSNLHQGDLDPDQLVIGTAALDARDRIIYDKTTGLLSYDPDGTGAAAAQAIAILSTFKGTLDATDFVIFTI